MSDNPILLPLVAEMLSVMSSVCTKFGIDFYLVGAIARDIHLSAHDELTSKRRTQDIDLAITISDQGQYNRIKASLIATGLFEGHDREPVKLIYKNGIEVDLLPFGEIEQPNRNVTLTDPTFVLNMPGFAEVYPFVKDHDIGNGQLIKVCTIEGIILLKLIANDDRPERTKDIADIEHLIQSYFDLNDDDIYAFHHDILELYDTHDKDYIQLICSRLIGRKIHDMLSQSKELEKRVRNILAKRETKRWHAMLMGMVDGQYLL
jgi:predicted nucleotidyltransferase